MRSVRTSASLLQGGVIAVAFAALAWMILSAGMARAETTQTTQAPTLRLGKVGCKKTRATSGRRVAICRVAGVATAELKQVSVSFTYKRGRHTASVKRSKVSVRVSAASFVAQAVLPVRARRVKARAKAVYAERLGLSAPDNASGASSPPAPASSPSSPSNSSSSPATPPIVYFDGVLDQEILVEKMPYIDMGDPGEGMEDAGEFLEKPPNTDLGNPPPPPPGG